MSEPRDPAAVGPQLCGPRGADGFVLGAAAALEARLATIPDSARPLPPLAAPGS